MNAEVGYDKSGGKTVIRPIDLTNDFACRQTIARFSLSQSTRQFKGHIQLSTAKSGYAIK
ncbi:hypothetical protein [Enterobacter hormaechei]|uniref:hypothetical protein n=1 Tax=Enterobacter hormaechei TaxID=158836 RepID=UPI000AF8EFFC|nr:hypothetical protein [Enterobacter hormaechei]GJG69840.1 hypothetical protein NIHE100087_03220 [Enterobacter hormaechei]